MRGWGAPIPLNECFAGEWVAVFERMVDVGLTPWLTDRLRRPAAQLKLVRWADWSQRSRSCRIKE
jgi:hypothetical protein